MVFFEWGFFSSTVCGSHQGVWPGLKFNADSKSTVSTQYRNL